MSFSTPSPRSGVVPLGHPVALRRCTTAQHLHTPHEQPQTAPASGHSSSSLLTQHRPLACTSIMSSSAAWTELVPPTYPEGNSVPVYCHKCGDKNRQDDGWRYRNDPQQRAAVDASARASGFANMDELMRRVMGPQRGFRSLRWAELTYECSECRDDRPQQREQDEEKEEEKKEESQQGQHDPIAFRTRSRTNQQQH